MREQVGNNPELIQQMRLDGPDYTLDPYKFRDDTPLYEFPGNYLTPLTGRLVRLWKLQQDGLPPRTDGVLHWPPRLVAAFRLLSAEDSLWRASKIPKP